jgi:2-methylcitrate dehydratase
MGVVSLMIDHQVHVHPSSARLAREDQLAWKLAAVASDPVEVPAEVTEMVINRLIDDAAVAAASLARGPARAAREQALRHPSGPGALLRFPGAFSPLSAMLIARHGFEGSTCQAR